MSFSRRPTGYGGVCGVGGDGACFEGIRQSVGSRGFGLEGARDVGSSFFLKKFRWLQLL